MDPILARLSMILDGKVGPRYEAARLRQIVQETVEYRFPNEIPPGYMDVKNKNALGASGDVILWYQMLDRLRSRQGSFTKVVWITTDVKEDLWVLDDKDRRALRARPELVQEMYDEAGAELLMVTLREFLAGAKDFLNADISDETLEQADELAAPAQDSFGLLNRWFMSNLRRVDDSSMSMLATLVLRGYVEAGYTVIDRQVRDFEADMVMRRGDQTTVVAIRVTERDVNKAMAGLVIAADELSATGKVIIYTGSFTSLQLRRGHSIGIEMRDIDDLADLIGGQGEPF